MLYSQAGAPRADRHRWDKETYRAHSTSAYRYRLPPGRRRSQPNAFATFVQYRGNYTPCTYDVLPATVSRTAACSVRHEPDNVLVKRAALLPGNNNPGQAIVRERQK